MEPTPVRIHPPRHPDYHWLRSIGMGWVLLLEPIGNLMILTGALALLVGGIRFGLGPFFLVPAFALVGFGFLLKRNFVILIYRKIRCPFCGHNPMRPAHGRYGDLHIALRKLRRISTCPGCRQSPDDEEDAVPVVLEEDK